MLGKIVGRLCVVAAAAALIGGVSAGAQAPQAPRKWLDSLTFKGFIQMDATMPQVNGTYGAVSNFRIRRARPTFLLDIDPLTKVQMQLDLGTKGANGGASSATVINTFVERKFPSAGFLSVGQFLVPFGREIRDDTGGTRTPLECSYTATRFAFSEWEVGASFRTIDPNGKLTAEVAVVNGQGVASADTGNDKTVAARATARVSNALRIGVSGLTGTYKAKDGKEYKRNAMAVDAKYNGGKYLVFTGEFYNGSFIDSVDASSPAKARISGGYALVETWVNSLKSIPFLRYQRTYGDAEYQSWDLGLRYQMSPTQRITAQYDIVKGYRKNQFGLRWQVNF